MKILTRILSYVLVAAIAAAAATGICMSKMPESSKLDQLESLIEERFIGDYDQTAMEDAAADAMVAAIGDRWSYYIPAAEYAAYQEQMANAYVGIGITIALQEDGSMLVQQVTKNGPADLGGVKPGDILVGAEGVDAEGKTLDEISAVIRGEEGTQVTVSFLRDGQRLDITMTRSSIQVEVAVGQMLENNIGYIQIVNFDERCADETISEIKRLTGEGAQALIFDVRFNGGGYKRELVEILDYLLPEGPLFRSLDYRGNESVDKSDENFLDLPMAVLVNQDSYSAAEFFAAALREYEAAVVVGLPTTGKGYFQNALRLSDGSAVNLSVGKYFTPNGVSLADVGGLTPDVTVEIDDETAFNIYAGLLPPGEDPQVQAAMEELMAD